MNAIDYILDKLEKGIKLDECDSFFLAPYTTQCPKCSESFIAYFKNIHGGRYEIIKRSDKLCAGCSNLLV